MRGARIGGLLVTMVLAAAVATGAAAGAAPPRGLASACGTWAQPLVDVSRSNPHHPGISCIYLWDIASGPAPGRYAPQQAVTRAQMATFIARTLTQAGESLPPSPPPAFSDVPPGSTHARAIDQLAAIGIVSGEGGRYKPSGEVTRAQMASFLMRAAAYVGGDELPEGPDAFTDDQGDIHEANIDRAAQAGVAAGTGGSSFTPLGRVTRAQMGSFLARLLGLLVDVYEVPTRAAANPAVAGPPYRFVLSPGEAGNQQPARWNPCAAPSIPWRVVGDAQPAWVDAVSGALGDADLATGLRLRRDQGAATSRRIDVEFRPSSEFPEGVVGSASYQIRFTRGGEPEMISGILRFSREYLDLVTDPAAGAAGVEAARILTLHEVAHVFGLGHVDDPHLLMAPQLEEDLQDPYYGHGELDGLALVGAGRGCLP